MRMKIVLVRTVKSSQKPFRKEQAQQKKAQ
jgi:hypothetical protein